MLTYNLLRFDVCQPWMQGQRQHPKHQNWMIRFGEPKLYRIAWSSTVNQLLANLCFYFYYSNRYRYYHFESWIILFLIYVYTGKFHTEKLKRRNFEMVIWYDYIVFNIDSSSLNSYLASIILLEIHI